MDYNVRELSFEADALSALAGLASAVATTHACTYAAGLWKEDLQSGLCWFVTEYDRERIDRRISDERSLPSWSWISQRGKLIQFRGWEQNHQIMEHEGIHLVEYPPNSTASTDHESPFSSIKSKELLLTGRLRRLALEEISKRDFDRRSTYNDAWTEGEISAAQWPWRVRDITTDEDLGFMVFDSDPATFAFRHIYCLLCIARKKYGVWQLTCLGLVPTDETLEQFKRVGLIMLSKKDWFGELQNQFLQYKGRDTRFQRTIRLV